MSKRRVIFVIETWVKRAIFDLYLSVKHAKAVDFRLFCLEQGVEKLCKAYLLGSQGYVYEDSKTSEPEKWIESYVKELGHDLHKLLGFVSIGIDSLKEYLKEKKWIDLLNEGYVEGRYPTCVSRSLWMKHERSAVISDFIDKKAFFVAGIITQQIEQKFGVLDYLDSLTNRGISKGEVKRFKSVWEKRKRLRVKKLSHT